MSVVGILTLAGGHVVSAMQNLLALFFVRHCMCDQDEICCDVGAVQVEHPDTAVL